MKLSQVIHDSWQWEWHDMTESHEAMSGYSWQWWQDCQALVHSETLTIINIITIIIITGVGDHSRPIKASIHVTLSTFDQWEASIESPTLNIPAVITGSFLTKHSVCWASVSLLPFLNPHHLIPSIICAVLKLLSWPQALTQIRFK